MRLKLVSVVCVLVLIGSIFSGCGIIKDDNKKIGMVVSTLDNPFFVSMKEGAESKARKMGYKLVILNSQNDPATERSNVEDLVQQGVSAIIVNPTDSDAVINTVKVANNYKVPVITVDRQANGGKTTSFIASDNVNGGKIAAKFILNRLKDKKNIKIVEIQGTPGASASRDRGKGFHDIVDKMPNVKIVASQSADFDRQKGLSVMENIIQSTPEFDAVFSQNDEMALGALKALKTSKKNVIVVGFDGSDDGKKAVKSGNMTATIAQQPALEGETAVDTAIKIINNKVVEKNIPIDIVLFKK